MIGSDGITVAAAATARVWETGLDRDWATPARGMEWTCWSTAEHICDVLFSYACQLTARASAAYVKLLLRAEDQAGPADLIAGLRASAGILAAVVATTGAEIRAYHPSGSADAEGFAAMGATELLLHGEDVAVGLGLEYDAPQALCGDILARLFPTVEPVDDRWLTLRWATGRADIPGREHVMGWRWRAAPLTG